MGSYIPSSREQREEMLRALGLSDYDGLYADVPEGVLRNGPLNLPKGLSELELREAFERMAARNRVYPTVLRGAGAYDHYIPAVVDSVAGREELSTAYTPYQPEISQGILQGIFEFQTMICELTGMDASNASLYDGASAAAEAAMMCLSRRRSQVLVAETVHPDLLATLKTYCWGRDAGLTVIPAKDGRCSPEDAARLAGEETACVLFSQPNFFGLLEDASALNEVAHAAGAKAVMSVYPTALGLLNTPARCGADIAVGEGQPLGLPLSYGGPYLGFIACRKELMRSLPGRIAGETRDAQGRRAFVLTLQAREQHIRREKAGSNVCSNQALCAMRAAVYMAALGPGGLRRAAELCFHRAHYFARELCRLPGFRLVYPGEFFNEFVTTSPVPPDRLEQALSEHGILSGLPLGENLLWCVTEKQSRETLDRALDCIREVVKT